MAGTVEQKLAGQGVIWHEPPNPVANSVCFVRSGNLLFISGQVCVDPQGKLIAKGKPGAGVTIDQGNAAGRGGDLKPAGEIQAGGGGPRQGGSRGPARRLRQ